MTARAAARAWVYPGVLEDAVLLGRRKRFLADVRRPDGTELTVHCANPGRMTTCSTPGAPVRIRDSGDPRRRLPWSLEQVRDGGSWVMVHTAHPNAVVDALIGLGAVPGLEASAPRRREVVDGAGQRFDLRLDPPGGRRTWVEVKNVTWRVGREARFPDAVTERGRRHLDALAARVAAGERAVLVFYVARGDVHAVRPADDVDPAYGAALRAAAAAGVEILALRSAVARDALGARGTLPVHLEPGA